ncbi:MAG: indolepyruvate oxidoreductase subunit beta family protein [Deltaproteobacteria bacterium]|nr:indolepyruvate oxidoreductase subunit beta family protein [Deltaproteobacteria bacterium]
MSNQPEAKDLRALTVLISALGGEGGGVLTGWIVSAAKACDLPVQATSIPGVAQRTGATTYYIEIWPIPWSRMQGRAPIFALSPAPGEVDLMAVTDLLEAGRAIRGGYVTPDRTFLIASTSRTYTTAEKMAADDGRYSHEALLKAAAQRSKNRMLLDLNHEASRAKVRINAVLLGVLAASEQLPMPLAALREVLAAEGESASSNRQGFEIGLRAAEHSGAVLGAPPPAAVSRRGRHALALLSERVHREFPESCQDLVQRGVLRMAAYQDVTYAQVYLERLVPFQKGSARLLERISRHLALWMSYEDAIRVAQMKTDPARRERIRMEAGAKPGEVVRVTEFLKPGLEELRDILPRPLARVVNALTRRWPRLQSLRFGMHLESSTVTGYLQLRFLAGWRRWRKHSWRFRQEQAAIEEWLSWLTRAAEQDEALALEIAECARMLKGYGDTHRRGWAQYRRIQDAFILPALEMRGGGDHTKDIASRIAAARSEFMANPDRSR